MTSKQAGGFELRGVVKPLVLFCRHLALLALCHLFSRQATRKSDILYKYSAKHCTRRKEKREKIVKGL
jgi:hypothetical protein